MAVNHLMNKFIKICLILSIAFLFSFGIALIVISFIPINEVKVLFDPFAIDGDAKYISMKNVVALRLVGIFTCVISGLIYIGRKKLLQYISDILEFIANLSGDFKETLKKDDKSHTYFFVLIIFAAITVRILYLFEPLYGDEPFNFEYRINHGNLIRLIAQRDAVGNHQFHNILSYLIYKFLGSEQYIWIHRLPTLFAGILLVPASYTFIRILYNKNAALLATGIIAASLPLIHYSTMARGYTMVCLFSCLILALGAYLKKNNNLAGWHILAIISAFGFYTIPVMLYPYGIVITWLLLSIIFKDTQFKRTVMLKNLLISVTITVFFTFLLYSPVILLASGFDAIFRIQGMMQPQSLAIFIKEFPPSIVDTWNYWHKSMPDIITMLLVIGLFTSLVFHKKVSRHRIPLALAASIWLIPVLLIHRVIPPGRAWLFILPLYIGVSSSGLTYLFRPVETVFRNYKFAMVDVFAIILSIALIGNIIYSRSLLNDIYRREASEFHYINSSLRYHITHDADNKAKYLIIFPSPIKNDSWKILLHRSFGKFIDSYFISDLNLSLSEGSRRCHTLLIISSESIPILEVLLRKKGLSVSDYSMPQLIHRFEDASMYKMSRTKNCIADPPSQNHFWDS